MEPLCPRGANFIIDIMFDFDVDMTADSNGWPSARARYQKRRQDMKFGNITVHMALCLLPFTSRTRSST